MCITIRFISKMTKVYVKPNENEYAWVILKKFSISQLLKIIKKKIAENFKLNKACDNFEA